jgi:hypothetical protein
MSKLNIDTSLTNDTNSIVSDNQVNNKLSNQVFADQEQTCQRMSNAYNYYINEPGMNFSNNVTPGVCTTPAESVLTRSPCLTTRHRKGRNIPGSYNLYTMNNSYVYGRNMLNDPTGFYFNSNYFMEPGISSRLTVRDINSNSKKMYSTTRGNNNNQCSGIVSNNVDQQRYYNLYQQQSKFGTPLLFDPNCMNYAQNIAKNSYACN